MSYHIQNTFVRFVFENVVLVSEISEVSDFKLNKRNFLNCTYRQKLMIKHQLFHLFTLVVLSHFKFSGQ